MNEDIEKQIEEIYFDILRIVRKLDKIKDYTTNIACIASVKNSDTCYYYKYLNMVTSIKLSQME